MLIDGETGFIELENDDDDDALVRLNRSGSRSKFFAPPLLGTKRGRSSTSSSSGLVLEPENLDNVVSSSKLSKLSSTGFRRCGRLIRDLSRLNWRPFLSELSFSGSLSVSSTPTSGLTLNTGLLILDLDSCVKIDPMAKTASNVVLSIMLSAMPE